LQRQQQQQLSQQQHHRQHSARVERKRDAPAYKVFVLEVLGIKRRVAPTTVSTKITRCQHEIAPDFVERLALVAVRCVTGTVAKLTSTQGSDV